MAVSVRQMCPEDARAFLEVHRAAVRGTAAKDYPPKVIETWAPLPLSDDLIQKVRANPDEELRWVAEIEGKIVGIGALVTKNAEVRACYVLPAAARNGVGSALLRKIERVAAEHGLSLLQSDSSITAEPFYKAHGYEVRERSHHVLGSGVLMACVKMYKAIGSQTSLEQPPNQ
ncbi:GCN5-related N-acetyltransferase protein [Rhizobium phaseoli]|uniref:GNAT family N-acetyltransferase n=1 Tax=Rhizobium phaseoli TaxID=396 RepID=UPI0007EA1327|nr:GNAT family N-acetyltransferase [Rhizobium phaseoli]ANL28630.1 GCN5-related N-acetyltransferase protein [Rhizobium phaseoli]ANM04960.1 GCN5-related N-acetyltransferase protein [Rhizobium phaseoli]